MALHTLTRHAYYWAFAAAMLLPQSVWASVTPKPCPATRDMNVTYGDYITCDIDVAGRIAFYHFQGYAGDSLMILVHADYNKGPAFALYDPSGAKIAEVNGWLQNVVSTDVVLTATGPYTVRVYDNQQNDIFPYRFYIERKPLAPTPMIFGQNVTGNINAGGISDQWSFTGATGDQIALQVTATYNKGPCYQIVQPDGTIFKELCGWLQSVVRGEYALPATGTYFVRVFDNGRDDIWTYSMLLQCMGSSCGIPVPSATGLRFVPVTPCRIADTRNPIGDFGGPVMAPQSTRSFAIPQSNCNIPTTALAYSLNVTVVPQAPLGYLTLWPTGQGRPLASTLNSPAGKIAANAAVVPAGSGGSVNVFVSDPTDVILDINGYFAPASTVNSLAFYPVDPCRISDTRNAAGAFGGPVLAADSTRTFAVPSSACNIPATAQAYSVNVTVVPQTPLAYLTMWPAGQARPIVSTLNSPDASVVANAAIVPAGTDGGVSVYVSHSTHVVLDINGYFAAPSAAGLRFSAVTPCRISDTRNAVGMFGGPVIAGGNTRTYPINLSTCAIPTTAQAYSLNATVVPSAALGFLTLWPYGSGRPLVSTLNSPLGLILANAAIVPAGGNGSIEAYVTAETHLILDINGYFAP